MIEQPATLRTHYQECVRLTAAGLKPSEVAQAMGLSTKQVKRIVDSDIAKERITDLQRERDERSIDFSVRLQALCEPAYQIIWNALTSGDLPGLKASDQIKAAFGALALNGHSPVQKSIRIEKHMTDEDYEEIRRRARRAGILPQAPIDVEAEVIAKEA